MTARDEAVANKVLELIESARKWGWRQAGGGVGDKEMEEQTKLRASELAAILTTRQEVAPVVDDAINIPKAQALIAAVGPGYRVIYRDAFRWKDDKGDVLPNHYEMFSAVSIAADFGYELILNLGYAAILRDTVTSTGQTSDARDGE